MAQAAAMLQANQDPQGARLIQDRMKEELVSMPLEEALPIVVRLIRLHALLIGGWGELDKQA
jgi:hypothetical protein